MKIVIAPDKFKGSLSAPEAASAIAAGVLRAYPSAQPICVPLADGGEGTMDSLIHEDRGQLVPVTVTGPLGSKVTSAYGRLRDGSSCVIEMAAASGLMLVPPDRRDALAATSYGTGELIRHALDAGCRRFIVAIGGSASSDGGAGMLQALGLRLIGADGNPLSPGIGGGMLREIVRIDSSGWDERIDQSQFIIASDVMNPLVGPEGAAHVFSPQKGASPIEVEELDRALTHWAELVERHTGVRIHDRPGAGAAGGIGGAFQAFFPAETQRGIDLVIEHTGLKRCLKGASALITGEGRIDAQTLAGKTPLGAAEAARERNIPVFVLAGSIGSGIEPLYAAGMTSVHSIVNGPMSLEESIARCRELLTERSEQVIRTWLASSAK